MAVKFKMAELPPQICRIKSLWNTFKWRLCCTLLNYSVDLFYAACYFVSQYAYWQELKIDHTLCTYLMCVLSIAYTTWLIYFMNGLYFMYNCLWLMSCFRIRFVHYSIKWSQLNQQRFRRWSYLFIESTFGQAEA